MKSWSEAVAYFYTLPDRLFMARFSIAVSSFSASRPDLRLQSLLNGQAESDGRGRFLANVIDIPNKVESTLQPFGVLKFPQGQERRRNFTREP